MLSQNMSQKNDNDMTQSKALHPWDVALVYDSLARKTCGHTITWDRFQNIPQKCPFCDSPVIMVCDKLVGISQENFVLFKYNKQTFMLSLNHAKRRAWWDMRECTAQERIAYALGMNEANGLKVRGGQQSLCLIGWTRVGIYSHLLTHVKVLCKGKVLYPNVNQTSTDISNQLIEISENDVENHHKKASLVVMGTRQGQGLHEPREGLFSILLGMGVKLIYNLFKLGCGTVVYLYSFVKRLLPPPEEGRRNE